MIDDAHVELGLQSRVCHNEDGCMAIADLSFENIGKIKTCKGSHFEHFEILLFLCCSNMRLVEFNMTDSWIELDCCAIITVRLSCDIP